MSSASSFARDAMTFVKANGGTVLGETRYPFPQTTDFSSQLLEAQAAGADVIGFSQCRIGHHQLHQTGA